MATNFNFDDFNKMTNRIPAGLALVLAKNLLKQAQMSFDFFDNDELATEVRGILGSLKEVIDTNKAQAAERAAKTGKLMASDGKSE